MEIVVPDKNLTVEKTLGVEDVIFRSVREAPFDVYGLYRPTEPGPFRRVPAEVADNTNPGVKELALNTAGGRVRFCTDSPYVAVRIKMPGVCKMPHIPLLGSSGMDLYLDNPATHDSRYCASFIPPMDMTDGYESIVRFPDRALRYFTVNLPTYNPVSDLFIGLCEGAQVGHGLAYRDVLPIVYYGSSITQGGCTSRPGNTYQTMITRSLDIDHINLGFSGSCQAEDVMVNYIASLPMSVFVSDYDHNAANAQWLLQTHEKMYRTIRAAHPDMPYIIVSRPDFHLDPASPARRDAVYRTYIHAWEAGDRQVFFVDGESMFRGEYEDCCTVDGCHPNDLGFMLMAKAIGCEIKRVLNGFGH